MSNFLEGKKTYIGIAMTIAGLFLPEVQVEAIGAALNDIFVAVGSVLAAYGRFKAKPAPVQPLGTTVPPPSE